MSGRDQQSDPPPDKGIKVVVFFDFRDKFKNNGFRNHALPIHFLIGVLNLALAAFFLWSNRFDLEMKHLVFPGMLTLVGLACFYLGHANWVASRQLQRIRRGACGGCGYDLQNTEGTKCPECGATIQTSRLRRGLEPEKINESNE